MAAHASSGTSLHTMVPAALESARTTPLSSVGTERDSGDSAIMEKRAMDFEDTLPEAKDTPPEAEDLAEDEGTVFETNGTAAKHAASHSLRGDADSLVIRPKSQDPPEQAPGDSKEDDTNFNSHDDVERPTPESRYLASRPRRIMASAFAIANLMISIDSSILATAIPHITSDFHTVDDTGWYGSAYLLTQMACQPVFGRVYVYFEPKWTYLTFLLVFEVGSIVCATAPTSIALIIGRAIAGCGAAGMLTGSLAIFARRSPPRRRPRGMAIMASVSSIASMLGSTVGGVITDSPLTWRFCFWINLPFGATTAVMIFFILDRTKRAEYEWPLLRRLRRLDPAGAILLAASLICLFLALQYLSSAIPASNARVYGCLIGCGILAVAFVGMQIYGAESAVVPPRLVKQRTVAVCSAFSFLYGMALFTHNYILPNYFQGVQGTSAAISGVYSLAFSISTTVCTLITGFTVSAYGYHVPFMWVGSLIYIAGSVLLYHLNPSNTAAQWIGYQILAGIGVGTTIQVTFHAVQQVTPDIDIPTVCALEIFFRLLGGSVGVSIAEAVFSNVLKAQLEQANIPGVNSTLINNSGIGQLAAVASKLSPTYRSEFRDALNFSITEALILPIATTSLAAVISWGMEWRQIPQTPAPDATDSESAIPANTAGLTGVKT